MTVEMAKTPFQMLENATTKPAESPASDSPPAVKPQAATEDRRRTEGPPEGAPSAEKHPVVFGDPKRSLGKYVLSNGDICYASRMKRRRDSFVFHYWDGDVEKRLVVPQTTRTGGEGLASQGSSHRIFWGFAHGCLVVPRLVAHFLYTDVYVAGGGFGYGLGFVAGLFCMNLIVGCWFALKQRADSQPRPPPEIGGRPLARWIVLAAMCLVVAALQYSLVRITVHLTDDSRFLGSAIIGIGLWVSLKAGLFRWVEYPFWATRGGIPPESPPQPGPGGDESSHPRNRRVLANALQSEVSGTDSLPELAAVMSERILPRELRGELEVLREPGLTATVLRLWLACSEREKLSATPIRLLRALALGYDRCWWETAEGAYPLHELAYGIV